ncbi:MAG: twin-arginine translocase TatA/TatE family subunit [Planctomycetes bacterium]|nr:twin-arginine translocase TatA/TatE family subunit [Planctomycetota bacterium]MCB9870256.1 twin-arginine translocase TatA/TatE family subunit [Planctomycetota bacterium]MCB9888164.1 twin-arginine translocase TatA/TatE family subunit [Planctomycetota bacterium]
MNAPVVELAYFLPGATEWVVILVVGIMLFGRRLPEVGRTVGKTIVQMRQGLHKLKMEMDLDRDLADVRDSVRDLRTDLDRSVEAPRKLLRDPGSVLMNLTDETLSTTESAPQPPKADR